MTELTRRIEDTLREMDGLGLRRTATLIESACAPSVRIAGKDALLMCSNDYLSLANRPELKEAAIKAVERYGFGAGAARLVSGTTPPHREFEERIAAFKKTEAALLFNSGYHANLGLLQALAGGRGADIFCDRLNHASIIDGAILSRARLVRFRHRDTTHLAELIAKSRAKIKLIVTDGVFSMDGVVAPLKELFSISSKYGATLIVDDAHATGVIGPSGRGTLEDAGIDDPSVIRMGTLGKALGSFGAFVAADKKTIDFLVNKARPFIYTTALPPAAPAAAVKALDIIEREPELRARLKKNAFLLKEALTAAGMDTLSSTTQIVPVVVKTPDAAVKASKSLLDDYGIFVQAIRPPTVPEGFSRLRATVTSGHLKEDVLRAAKSIIEAVNAP